MNFIQLIMRLKLIFWSICIYEIASLEGTASLIVHEFFIEIEN